ncbi:hypothetical protein C5S31_11375 [ANME-1 cluster archaeon GoMg2]|nr:hypothetical protein [ANME-1 cluster archaeon GoMg2]
MVEMSTAVKDIAREMLALAQEITRKKSPEVALRLVLEGYLERRIEECEDEISKFENKYGMSFEDYKEMLGEKFTLSYEHEKDYMDWEASVIEYKFLKEEKNKLDYYGY